MLRHHAHGAGAALQQAGGAHGDAAGESLDVDGAGAVDHVAGEDADVAAFPLNTAVLVTDVQAAIGKAGSAAMGTLLPDLQAMSLVMAIWKPSQAGIRSRSGFLRRRSESDVRTHPLDRTDG